MATFPKSGDRNVLVGGDASGNVIVTGDANCVYVYIARTSGDLHATAPGQAPNPYRGLSAFDETDANWFFGREELTSRIHSRLVALYGSGEHYVAPARILPILGPSGSGKSSVARAGLVPEVARHPLARETSAQVAVFTPDVHPVESLGGALARVVTKDPLPVAKAREFSTELMRPNAKQEFDGLLRIVRLVPNINSSPLILLIDQFEEVFSRCADLDERDAFVANLLAATNERSANVLVVLTMRSDYLRETQQYPELNRVIADREITVPVMSDAELWRAIATPAERAGHAIDPHIVNELIRQTRGREGALPLLQFALTRMWDEAARGIPFDVTLQALGGVGGALASEAQRLYDLLPEDEQTVARRIFLALVNIAGGMLDTRRRVSVSDPYITSGRKDAEVVRRVLRTFAQPGARIISLSADLDGTETAEITHEALLEHWQALRDWLAPVRDDLRLLRRLEAAAEDWLTRGRPVGLLWRSPDLELLLGLERRNRQDMTELQLEFFEASVALSNRERRRQRRLTAAGVTVAVVFALLTFVLLALYGNSRKQTQRAQTQENTARHLLYAANMQRIQEAWEAIPSQTGRVLELLESTKDEPFRGFEWGYWWRQSHDDLRAVVDSIHGGSSVTYWPDGRYLAIGDSATVRVWDRINRRFIATLSPDSGLVTSIAVFPDGRRLAAGLTNGLVAVFDVTSHECVLTLSGHGRAKRPDPDSLLPPIVREAMKEAMKAQIALSGLPDSTGGVNAIAISPDGLLIASAGGDHTLRVWDAASGRAIKTLSGFADAVRSVAFSRDGNVLASGDGSGAIKLWSVRDWHLRLTLKARKVDIVTSVAFSPDGQWLASSHLLGDNARTIWVWNVATGRELFSLTGHMDGVSSVSFSPDGKQLASGGVDNTVRIWDLATRREVRTLLGQFTSIRQLAYSPDGQFVASVGFGNVVEWDLTPSVVKLGEHHAEVTALAVSPAGRYAASGASDGEIKLWDLLGRDSARTLRGPTSPDSLLNTLPSVQQLVFSPDGKRLLASEYLGGVHLWDVPSGRAMALRGERDLPGYEAAPGFSTDSQPLAFSHGDGGDIVRNLETGRRVKKFGNLPYVFTAPTFSPDGTQLAFGGSDRESMVRIVSLSVFGATSTLQGLEEPEPVGRRPTNWFATDPRFTGFHQGEPYAVHCIAFSHDAARIAAGTANGIIYVWNAVRPREPVAMRGHTRGVTAVSFSPDARRVVSGSDDGTLRLWDVETGQELLSLLAHPAGVTSVAFSPDGTVILSGGKDRMVKVWRAAPR